MKSQFGAMGVSGTPKSQQNGNILTGQKSVTKPIVLVNNGVNQAVTSPSAAGAQNNKQWQMNNMTPKGTTPKG
jgi:hypothetical protein